MMTVADFERIALSFEGVDEGTRHMNVPDFRVNGRVFATLAFADQGLGNLLLTPEQQAAFVAEAPAIFYPVAGGWGRMGHTCVRLAEADEAILTGALRTAWKLRVEKNRKPAGKRRKPEAR